MQRAYAWRKIDPATADSIVGDLNKLKPVNVNLLYIVNDSESLYYAIHINDILVKAGWKVNAVSQSYPGLIVKGIIIPTLDDSNINTAVGVFVNNGIEITRDVLPAPAMGFGSPDNTYPVTILVGSHLPV